MAGTVPYIGSKISLVSNSDIRYEGILYTINTQESTIALQSVKTFGTEGRKIPEIPPSSEIYDFIIFRGTDIKDLTVLEGAGGSDKAMLSDPAIMSLNQRPAGGPGKDGKGKGVAKGGGKADLFAKGSGGGNRGWEQPSKGSGSGDRGWEQPAKGGSKGWGGGKSDGWGGGGGKSDGWGGKSDGWGKGYGKSAWDDGKGRGGYGGGGARGGGGGAWGGGGKGKDYGKGGKADKGKGKGGRDDGKGSKGKGKGDKGGKSSGKGDRGGNRGGKGMTANGVPVGELLPEDNATAKKEFAEDFDLSAAGTKFEKVTEESTDKKPLAGYNKTSSFFDNISCEATDRADNVERVKVDREVAREHDKDTFGDTRRPPRPVGVRRGKGKGKGSSK